MKTSVKIFIAAHGIVMLIPFFLLIGLNIKIKNKEYNSEKTANYNALIRIPLGSIDKIQLINASNTNNEDRAADSYNSSHPIDVQINLSKINKQELEMDSITRKYITYQVENSTLFIVYKDTNTNYYNGSITINMTNPIKKIDLQSCRGAINIEDSSLVSDWEINLDNSSMRFSSIINYENRTNNQSKVATTVNAVDGIHLQNHVLFDLKNNSTLEFNQVMYIKNIDLKLHNTQFYNSTIDYEKMNLDIDLSSSYFVDAHKIRKTNVTEIK